MKKMLSFLLMFAIMLLPISAFAAPGDAILLRQGVEGYNGSTRSMVEIDGTLYLLTYDSLYTLEDDGTTPTKHELKLLEETVAEDAEENDDANTSTSREALAIINYGGRPCLIVSESTIEVEGVGDEQET